MTARLSKLRPVKLLVLTFGVAATIGRASGPLTASKLDDLACLFRYLESGDTATMTASIANNGDAWSGSYTISYTGPLDYIKRTVKVTLPARQTMVVERFTMDIRELPLIGGRMRVHHRDGDANCFLYQGPDEQET